VNVSKEDLRLKWGVGRLILDSPRVPTVLPIYHVGLDSVLPNRRPYFPRALQRVTVSVGQPVDVAVWRAAISDCGEDEQEKRKRVTDLVQERFLLLAKETSALHLKC
jgi:monolysocardiolipin acyltransferase